VKPPITNARHGSPEAGSITRTPLRTPDTAHPLGRLSFLAILDILVTVGNTVSPAAQFSVAVFRGRDAMEPTVDPISVPDAVHVWLTAGLVFIRPIPGRLDACAIPVTKSVEPQYGSLM
jgi:hypothetical protein